MVFGRPAVGSVASNVCATISKMIVARRLQSKNSQVFVARPWCQKSCFRWKRCTSYFFENLQQWWKARSKNRIFKVKRCYLFTSRTAQQKQYYHQTRMMRVQLPFYKYKGSKNGHATNSLNWIPKIYTSARRKLADFEDEFCFGPRRKL